jgi:hypothetical protein
MMIESVINCEISFYFGETALLYTAEGCHLHN